MSSKVWFLFEHLPSLIPAGLLVQQVLPSPDLLTIVVAPREPCAACPSCATLSSHVHSRYDRLLQDVPWQGRQVLLRVRARRFRCLAPACPRLTFAERLADTAPAAARRTERLADLQRHLGLVVGGEVGARLAARLAMPVSGDTLLRMARRAGATPQPRPPVRVLAVDEWAWRRGHRYGTVLVDLERNSVVDLLPDRQAESLAAWLKANPSVAVIARDRAGVFADGIRQGAPNATEVADRWHLLRNLGDAVHAVAQHHNAAARRIAKEIMAHPPCVGTSGEATTEPATAVQRRSTASHAHRQAQLEEAARLHAAGASISAIARQLGLDRKTLRHWLQAGTVPTWHKPRRGSMLDPYRDHLERRWSEGCHNAARLWQELVALGFPGRTAIVGAWATERRRAAPTGSSMPVTAEGKPWRPPSGRRVVRLLMADARNLSPPDRAFAAQLLKEEPGLEITVAAAKRLQALLRRRSEETLADVLAAAEQTQLAGFVAEMRKDIGAVEAALTLPWTTSPAEGQINRIKMIKRTMYGRAGFELLRARVLHAA
ncbi:ISL3 family transposase [Paracraurococcus lichenis]|uniref:ISL3 family transposase n=1 Tax=Paracraurococcus lichenis TaxID=3064888 RepID=A0ABT9EEC1_9PROT|nr:ISL3 family transposase [Paracraurococcus sp. LOR1-02]MDO9714446.1 ISL3 family transposase [Paracraurococcus sp. LOR1-02]